MYSLKGRHVLITGASSGIGREMAGILAEEKANLLMVAHPAEEAALAQWAAELGKKRGVKTWAAAVDLAASDGPREVFARAEEVLPRIDVLINNAGILGYGEFRTMPEDEIDRLLSVNCRAYLMLMRLVLPGMIERGEGRILNTSSLGAFQPTPIQAVYGATKALVQSLSEAVAMELEGTGVIVCTLNPGVTGTRFLEGYAKEAQAFRWGAITSPTAVAREAIDGLKKGRTVIIPGLYNKTSARVLSLLPRRWRSRMVYRAFAPQKGGHG